MDSRIDIAPPHPRRGGIGGASHEPPAGGGRKSRPRPGAAALALAVLLAAASPSSSAVALPGSPAAEGEATGAETARPEPGGAAPAVVTTTYISLFGTREVRSTNLKAFKQWLSVMEREARDRPYMDKPCPEDTPQLCLLLEWKTFLERIKDRDRMAQLQEVNGYMNAHPYIIDAVNWGVPDYWAVPREFFDRHGDCEDYAIAKFYSLRWLGMTDAELRVVVLQDLNLQVPHAVLAAYLDGKIYILDNQIPQVVAADIIKHYRPFYSINETAWWLHRPR